MRLIIDSVYVVTFVLLGISVYAMLVSFVFGTVLEIKEEFFSKITRYAFVSILLCILLFVPFWFLDKIFGG